jgi:hypothetical protein
VKIPGHISPIIGYRVWQWDAAGLRSLNGEPWLPGRPLQAGCRASSCGTLVGRAEAAHGGHDAPQANCTCGVYAAKSLEHLSKTGYQRYGIHGEVNLWGNVVEHEQGWRAQFAYPKNLFLPLEMMPIGMGSVESRLKTVAAYGCDIHVLGEEGNVPLWVRGSGYDPTGLDLLVQRCKGWYAQRARVRRIGLGDRVAILGRGIAVVEQVEGRWIQAVLWNRSVLRIGRKEIVWDEQNMRWEVDPSGVPQRPPAMDLACARITGGRTQWTT